MRDELVFIKFKDEEVNELKNRILKFTTNKLRLNGVYPTRISLDERDIKKLMEDEICVIDNNKILGMKIEKRRRRYE